MRSNDRFLPMASFDTLAKWDCSSLHRYRKSGLVFKMFTIYSR
jgi:hypothetical protein